MSSKKAPNVALHLNLLPLITSVKAGDKFPQLDISQVTFPDLNLEITRFGILKLAVLSLIRRGHALSLFFLVFFGFVFLFSRRRDCSPDMPTCGWIGSKIAMKGIFDKSAFLRITINTERCRQSEPPLKKSLFSKLAFIFFHTMINFRFFLSSHHFKLFPQHLYRRTSSAFGDFALKHSLHLKAINHATITTQCVTVLLFISWFQVATLHLSLK